MTCTVYRDILIHEHSRYCDTDLTFMTYEFKIFSIIINFVVYATK